MRIDMYQDICHKDVELFYYQFLGLFDSLNYDDTTALLLNRTSLHVVEPLFGG